MIRKKKPRNKRDKIRQAIIDKVGKDPGDNFQILWDNEEGRFKVRIRWQKHVEEIHEFEVEI